MFVNGKSLMMSAAVSERPAKWSLTPSSFSIIAQRRRCARASSAVPVGLGTVGGHPPVTVPEGALRCPNCTSWPERISGSFRPS